MLYYLPKTTARSDSSYGYMCWNLSCVWLNISDTYTPKVNYKLDIRPSSCCEIQKSWFFFLECLWHWRNHLYSSLNKLTITKLLLNCSIYLWKLLCEENNVAKKKILFLYKFLTVFVIFHNNSSFYWYI